jgi:hypothetical protein
MKRQLTLLVGVGVILALIGVLSVWFVNSSERNHTDLPPATSDEQYSFFVAGHTYGVPSVDNEGVHPPFKPWFTKINSQDLDFGVFTGDIVIRGTPANWDEIDAELTQLTPPVHFTVGNHDLSDRKLFASRYGPTYYSYEHKGDLFVFLDGERDPCNIGGEQLMFLQDALADTDARNVFIFVHKLIWVAEGTPYYKLRRGLNTKEGYNFQNNFWVDVAPLLRNLKANVYVVAGDVGVTWAMPLFYEQDGNIHFVASGMGGTEEENYLTFHAGADGVHIEVQRLDGEPLSLGSIEAYDLAHYSGE